MLNVSSLGTLYRIIGIDPGTETLGVSVLDVNLKDYTIHSVEAFTFEASKSIYYNKELAKVHGHKVARLKSLELSLMDLFKEKRPDMVSVESPFYNALRPNAFAPLVETLMVIRETLIKFDWHMVLAPLDPPRVKKAIGAKGNAKKEEVKKALELKLKELNLSKETFEQLDEHSIDAICVAYAHYLKLKSLYKE